MFELVRNTGHQGIGYLVLVVIVMALVLLRAAPTQRRPLLSTLLLFVSSLAGLFVSALIDLSGYPDAAQSLRQLSILLEGLAVIRLWGLLLFRWLLPRLRLMPPRILEDMTVIGAYIIWGLMSLNYAGLDLSSIVATSAVITAVIAFSMQDTLGNILGGIALQLDDSLKVGDWIKVDDVSGRVVDIRWRSTSVETRNWETVIIPNSQLMKGKFMVLGRRSEQPEQWRRWVWFNVGYGEMPARVIEVVERALSMTDIVGVAKMPMPNCVMMEFGESTARYAVRYWLTDLARDDPTDSAVRVHVFNALQRADIVPAIPERYLHLEQDGTKYLRMRHSREIEQRLDVLKNVELFRSLTDEELRLVAERLKFSPFAAGDVMTQQGARAHWLYILTEGQAEVVLDVDGQRKTLNIINTDEGPCFFGEMGLMTGDARVATVIARTGVECYRLDKSSFESIVKSRPAMVEEISQVIAVRRATLDTARTALDARSLRASGVQREPELLRRIKDFFRLDD